MKATILVAAASAVKLTSDPICSSAGCTQYKHPDEFTGKINYPIDYAVPNFGRDQDIEHSDANMKAAEEIHGKWNPKWDEDDKKFIVPQPIPDSDYTNARYMMPDHELLSLWIETDKLNAFRPPPGSNPWHDPYVGSKKQEVVVTFPNNGLDEDIIHTHKHVADAEKKLKDGDKAALSQTDKVATFRPPADRTPWHEPCVGTGAYCT